LKPFLPALCVFAAAAAGATDVPTAYQQSSARLTGLRLDLLDLRPDDGIAPALTIEGQAWTRARSNWYCDTGGQCHEARGTPFSSELSVLANRRNDDITTTGHITGTSLEATTSSLSGNVIPFSAFSRISGDAENARPLFILTPYTAVRITGRYELDAWVVDEDNDTLTYSARVLTWGAEPGATSAFIHVDDSGPNMSAHESGNFAAVWSNATGRTHNVWGGFLVEAKGEVSAVPEPGTLALMAAGLGLVGTVAGRRRAGKA
jgi:hypothetical protein